MGTRRKADRIEIPWLVRRVVEFQAAESFPLEVAGILVGDHSRIETVGVITKYDTRTNETIVYDDESNQRADDVFGETVGSFHSHPGWPERISRPGDYKNGVRKGCSDLEHMEDDDLEWIVSVWPGIRKWRFRHRLYARQGNRPLIVPIVWG